MSRGERGTAAIAEAGLAGVLAALTIAVAAVGIALSARVQASNAADAAALAAAVATYPGAASEQAPGLVAGSIARLNGARLISCQCPRDTSLSARVVTVVVTVPVSVPFFGDLDIRAAARAEFDPRRWLGR